MTAQVTLTGQPAEGAICQEDSYVLLTLTSSRHPSPPKGVPIPPEQPTNYNVYVGNKLWRRVAEAARDPEDALIIDGYPQIDMETQSIAIIATGITSRKLKAAGRKPKQPQPE